MLSLILLEGDALGHKKDNFGGSGANYHLLCYIPDARTGKSRISVVKEGLEVEPVIVEYDTVRTVQSTWGSPMKRGSKIEIPVFFGTEIRNLKRSISLSRWLHRISSMEQATLIVWLYLIKLSGFGICCGYRCENEWCRCGDY